MLKIKKIKPLFDQIVTTTERYTEDSVADGIILDKTQVAGYVKEYQKVLAVGSAVREIKVGDLVMIDPTAYTHKKFGTNTLRDDMGADNPIENIQIPTVTTEDGDVFLINQRDVSFVIEDYEEEEAPKMGLILPKKPKIQL